MENMVNFILASLILLSIWFIVIFLKDFLKNKNLLEKVSWMKTGIIGFVVNFFDVLGIGAFAPQTALLKFTKQTSDRQIPGTMNIANTLPVLLQAMIFIKAIEVEPVTLITMFISATLGAILGAEIIGKLSDYKIRIMMSIALLITACFMFANNMQWIKGNGDAVGLYGWKLILAAGANFVLGGLMTTGVGLYAPCMALVYILGMSPKVAFPIMMGSCAFLMPPAAHKFIKSGSYNRKAALGMAIPSIVAVLIAAFIVKSLPIQPLRWLVLVVIIYTAVNMIWNRNKE